MRLVLHGMKQKPSVFKTLLKYRDGWALSSSVLLKYLCQSARQITSFEIFAVRFPLGIYNKTLNYYSKSYAFYESNP